MTGGRWDAHELADLRRLAGEGASGPEIANRLGRSTGAVQQKALELGIELVRVDRTPWRRGEAVPPVGADASRQDGKREPAARRSPM